MTKTTTLTGNGISQEVTSNALFAVIRKLGLGDTVYSCKQVTSAQLFEALAKLGPSDRLKVLDHRLTKRLTADQGKLIHEWYSKVKLRGDVQAKERPAKEASAVTDIAVRAATSIRIADQMTTIINTLLRVPCVNEMCGDALKAVATGAQEIKSANQSIQSSCKGGASK